MNMVPLHAGILRFQEGGRYLLTGEQCVELPDRVVRARAGEAMFAPADTPMMLNIMGKSKRDALFMVVHDPARPWNTFVDWKPRGLCRE